MYVAFMSKDILWNESKLNYNLLLAFRQNFVQVDIFYKKLTEEVVTQMKKFEFLSLLSEVGGFLGLLLGASIMTICEVLDYIMMKVMYAYHAHKKRGHGHVIPMPGQELQK